MFAISQFNFTEENIRYFSNINHLAKDIRKFFIFLSNREKIIFEELDKIKHTQLLQTISKAFGLRQYNGKQGDLIVDLCFLNKLFKCVSEYVLKNTEIKEEFIIEVFNLLLLNIKKSSNLKSSIMRKINLRIKHLEDFNNLDIYSTKRVNKKQKIINDHFKDLISEADYQIFKELYYDFKFNFDTYTGITKKNFQFVWYPYAFEKYVFSFSRVEENKEMLEKAKLYKYFTDIKVLLNDWIMASNVQLFNNENIEETYYLQNDNKYAECLLVNYEINLAYHGGSKFGALIVGPSPLIALKKEHLKEKYGNKVLLKKLTWDYSNYFLLNIHTYDNVFDFCCGEDFLGFKNASSNTNDCFMKCFNFNHKDTRVECFSHFGNKCYNTKDIKNFFFFKRDEDYFEYHIFDKDDLVYKVQFKIDQFFIKTQKETIAFDYDILFKNESFDIEI